MVPADLVGQLGEVLGQARLLLERPLVELLPDRLRQVLRDEALHHVALPVRDTVNAEIEIRAIELEQLAQQPLELLKRRHASPRFDFPAG